MSSKTIYVKATVTGVNHNGISEIMINDEKKGNIYLDAGDMPKNFLAPAPDMDYSPLNRSCFAPAKLNPDGTFSLELKTGRKLNLDLLPRYVCDREEALAAIFMEKIAFITRVSYADLDENITEAAGRNGIRDFRANMDLLERAAEEFNSNWEYGLYDKYCDTIYNTCNDVFHDFQSHMKP